VKLTPAELASVRSKGVYITEKCDGCGKLLNQSVRYTIAGKPEVYCSAECRDAVFFGDQREVNKHAGKRRCANCGGGLQTKKRGAVYCDDVCRKRATRKERCVTTGKVERSRTPTQQNEELAEAKIGGLG
jgi:hypothetical protein